MLSGTRIAEEVARHNIRIEPFDRSQCGPNSYDLRLGNKLVQVVANTPSGKIDTGDKSKVVPVDLEFGYFKLNPGVLYLGHTVETVGSTKYAPILHGRSSAARHGLMVHFAGFCDVGWLGEVTLEIVNMTDRPMLIYPGDRVCQLQFDTVEGDVEPYDSTYQFQTGPTPAKGLGD